MLKVFNKLSELDFALLMDLYREGNRENAEDRYAHLEEAEGLRRAEADFYEYLREDFFCQKDAFYCVLERNGFYLSALRLEPYEDGWLLEALETHPDHRRRGYAGELIRRVQALLSQRDRKALYSHVSKGNLPSMRTHLSAGFRVIRDSARYIDGTVTTRAVTLLWTN